MFHPHLIVVDLFFSRSQSEGIQLVREIHKVDALKTTPIVICSKWINDTPIGCEMRVRCRRIPGVVEAFGKVPDYPDASALLYYARAS